MLISKINSENYTFSSTKQMNTYKKLHENDNIKVTLFSDLSQAEKDQVFLKITEFDKNSTNPIHKTIKSLLIELTKKSPDE